MVQSGSEAVTLFQPLFECFRPMEGEDFSGTGPGIPAIRKPGNNAGTLIEKRQGFVVIDPFQGGVGIAFGLLFHGGDVFAFALALCLNDTNSPSVNEEHVVCWTDISLVFPDSLPNPDAWIKFLIVLHAPA